MFSKIAGKTLKLYFFLFIAIIYVPLLLIILFSFNDSILAGFPFGGFTLKWWENFLRSPVTISCITNSILLASTVATMSTLLGLLAAFILVRKSGFRGEGFLTYSMIMLMALPYLLLGVGLLSFLRTILNMELSLLTVFLGHVLVALPYTTLTLVARLTGFNVSLEEAAMDLGANEIATFTRITLPLILPGIISAFFTSFTISLEDAALAHFLSGRELTIPIFVYGQLRRWSGLPLVMCLSSFLVILTIILVVVFIVLERRRE